MSEHSLPGEATVKIRAEPSAIDPDSCKFAVSRTVHPGGPFFFDRREKAEGSPLIEQLFELPGVVSVLVAGSVVTVGKAPDASWGGLLKPIGAAIRTQLRTGVPCIFESAPALHFGDRSDAELARLIQELLDRQINPGLASHGGSISVEKVQDAVLYVRLSGGCQGCAASKLTLNQGVEVLVRKTVPEIRDVVDLTDHAAGRSPYYAPTL
jgi:Fe-S cluster biogenesis protein NfuA